MGEHFLRIIAGLFVGIWVARYLGPEQFGLFSYVLAFTAIFGGIAKLGLDAIIVRELLNHPEKRDIYLGTAFWLKIFGALLAMALIALLAPLTSNDSTTNLFIFIVAAGLVFQSFEVVEFYFQSQVLAKITAICKVFQLSLSSLTKICLVLNDGELIFFVIITLFDAITLALSYFVAYKYSQNPVFYKQFNFDIAKQLLRESWYLMFSAIVVMIYMRVDQVMIKEMLDGYQVGIYSAALRLSEVFYFIPVMISASLFPAIIESKKQGTDIYKQRLQRFYTFMVWLAVAIALTMTILADWLILTFFGEAYQDASVVLKIHLWALPFTFLFVASAPWFINENFGNLAFYRAFSASIINIILNFMLIPKYEIMGAAFATVIAFFISGYIFDITNYKLRQQFVMKTKSFLGRLN